MGDKKLYVVAKIFDKQGCIAYSCKTHRFTRDISRIFAYTFVDDMKEYIDMVAKLNTVA